MTIETKIKTPINKLLNEDERVLVVANQARILIAIMGLTILMSVPTITNVHGLIVVYLV